MSTKEYAGTDLREIREFLLEAGYTEVFEDVGAKGFILSTFHEYGTTYARFVAVWPRNEGGYWCEEY